MADPEYRVQKAFDDDNNDRKKRLAERIEAVREKLNGNSVTKKTFSWKNKGLWSPLNVAYWDVSKAIDAHEDVTHINELLLEFEAHLCIFREEIRNNEEHPLEREKIFRSFMQDSTFEDTLFKIPSIMEDISRHVNVFYSYREINDSIISPIRLSIMMDLYGKRLSDDFPFKNRQLSEQEIRVYIPGIPIAKTLGQMPSEWLYPFIMQMYIEDNLLMLSPLAHQPTAQANPIVLVDVAGEHFSRFFEDWYNLDKKTANGFIEELIHLASSPSNDMERELLDALCEKNPLINGIVEESFACLVKKKTVKEMELVSVNLELRLHPKGMEDAPPPYEEREGNQSDAKRLADENARLRARNAELEAQAEENARLRASIAEMEAQQGVDVDTEYAGRLAALEFPTAPTSLPAVVTESAPSSKPSPQQPTKTAIPS